MALFGICLGYQCHHGHAGTVVPSGTARGVTCMNCVTCMTYVLTCMACTCLISRLSRQMLCNYCIWYLCGCIYGYVCCFEVYICICMCVFQLEFVCIRMFFFNMNFFFRSSFDLSFNQPINNQSSSGIRGIYIHKTPIKLIHPTRKKNSGSLFVRVIHDVTHAPSHPLESETRSWARRPFQWRHTAGLPLQCNSNVSFLGAFFRLEFSYWTWMN